MYPGSVTKERAHSYTQEPFRERTGASPVLGNPAKGAHETYSYVSSNTDFRIKYLINSNSTGDANLPN